MLEAELATLTALSTALDAEYDALIANDPQALESATRSKAERVDAHRAQQQKRISWLTARGLPPETSLKQLVLLAGDDERVADLQVRLAALASSCQQNNRRNGGLIVRLQERARGALDVLRRDDGGDLYSLSGAREHQSDSRTLGKA
ncbi:MAG: flagellar protein FlgN [Pseudomonadota bacterium]